MSDEILEPLYVDSRSDDRSAAIFRELVRVGVLDDVGIEPEVVPYVGDGTLARPFITLDQARAVQKPGQPIIIAGWATIGPAKLDS